MQTASEVSFVFQALKLSVCYVLLSFLLASFSRLCPENVLQASSRI